MPEDNLTIAKNVSAVLVLFADLEYQLEQLINTYYTIDLPESKGASFVGLLPSLSFGAKKQAFQRIAEAEGFTKNNLYAPALEAMKIIKETRNAIAHGKRVFDESKNLWVIKYTGQNGKEIMLDEPFVNDLSSKQMIARTAVGVLSNKIYGIIDKFD
ncbi:MAG: hypothetical protein WCW13_02835 [archaeon]|jgi:hypothetical protein